MSRWRTVALLGVCVAVLVGGIAAVLIGMQEQPPKPTPTPTGDSSLSADDARAVPRAEADAPVDIPEGDHGPFVRTDPVDSSWTDLVAPDGAPGSDTRSSSGGSGGDDGAVDGGSGLAANRLVIPALYVDAGVVAEGVREGSMTLPDDLASVGHLKSTAAMNATSGTSLVAGHVTHNGTPGALFLLGKVRPGASVITTDSQGSPTTWVVTTVKSYRKTALPNEIFRKDGTRQLAVVTCGGRVIRTQDGRYTHEDNIVVTAVPASTA